MEIKGRSYINSEYSKGFLLSEENIVKLYDIIQKRIKESNIEGDLIWEVIRCDDLVYETRNSSDILNEENSKRNSINTLSLFFKSEKLKFNLNFDKKEGVNLIIDSGNRDFSLLLRSDIKEYLQAEVLVFRDFTFSNQKFERYILLCLPMIILYFTLKMIPSNEDATKVLQSSDLVEKVNYLIERGKNTTASSLYWILGFGVILSLVGSFMGSILDNVYPRNIFYFGKEKLRYIRLCEMRSRWIWGIGIAFLISCISSYIVWFATK